MVFEPRTSPQKISELAMGIHPALMTEFIILNSGYISLYAKNQEISFLVTYLVTTLQIAIPFCETTCTGHSPYGRSICIALALMASSKQWLCPLWQVQIHDSDPYGKIKSMALLLMASSNL